MRALHLNFAGLAAKIYVSDMLVTAIVGPTYIKSDCACFSRCLMCFRVDYKIRCCQEWPR